MKHFLFISALVVILFSCKKEISQNAYSPSLVSSIKSQLKDSILTHDFEELDFNNTVITNYPDNDLSFLRIPFTNKSIAIDFVLLKIEKKQYFSMGKIISLTRNKTDLFSKGLLQFNGNINIFSLKRNLLTASLVTNGYIEAFNTNAKSIPSKEAIVELTKLPEIIIYCRYPSSGKNASMTEFFNLHNIFSGSGDGSSGAGGVGYTGTGSGGYYSAGNPFGTSGGHGGSGGGGSPTPNNAEPILIDYEPVENLAAIDIQKYLKCFNNIPDAGATCTIKLLTDIPVDKDPNAFFDWKNNSPGHTFIQITKVNGSQTVQQNIGFYPTINWKNVLTTAPVDGKIVDNKGHEFNSSLTMDLTPEKFQHVLTHIQYLANFIKYDIDEYNCTDFALDVFNYQRGGNQLTIPLYDIPGGTAVNGTATPQGLYQKLNLMKKANDADSKNITIPGVKGFAGNSNGPCN